MVVLLFPGLLLVCIGWLSVIMLFVAMCFGFWLVAARDFLSPISLVGKGALFSWSCVPDVFSCFGLLRIGHVIEAGSLPLFLALFRAASPPAAVDYGSWHVFVGHLSEDGSPLVLRFYCGFSSWCCFVSDAAFPACGSPAIGQIPWSSSVFLASHVVSVVGFRVTHGLCFVLYRMP
ncbi:uncharacterized protein LOC132306286 isoform X2 [Cornus florida]|uniref:uncharacterized protein LOC132306286 isoform X2 n=1 Tax=Cornus florida TaxID=4283 RepID=UPI002896F6FA|nr:uncharacterized protein LOC132306286 isoform X2 [Cornus florida]